MAQNYLLSIGIMTGNSLDGADGVLSRFDEDGTILDLVSHSKKYPRFLGDAFRLARKVIIECAGEMGGATVQFDNQISSTNCKSFDDLISIYNSFLVEVVNELIEKAKTINNFSAQYDLSKIDLIGLHGQTCAHQPPSITKSTDPKDRYTVQLGDGQRLADATGITVVYDFRSDDLMQGGEGAPLAPLHHEHLAKHTKKQGFFPLAFCNGGNTGNISIISHKDASSEIYAIGWDSGPFNHLPDILCQTAKGADFDQDGKWGKQGSVNVLLLEILFDSSVVTKDGDNFLHRPPPKSSDPQWYKILTELSGRAIVGGKILTFEDRLRTAEYFAAYCLYFSLTLLAEEITIPTHFALCGGGWRNPIMRDHFKALLQGDRAFSPVLPKHEQVFKKLEARLKAQAGDLHKVNCQDSSFYGFDGTAMEARIFADAAVCRVRGIPFSKPQTTAVSKECVLGIIKFPFKDQSRATAKLSDFLANFQSVQQTADNPQVFDPRWSRASAGWSERLKTSP